MSQPALELVPEEPELEYVLYDAMRDNYVMSQMLTTTEAIEWTGRLKKSFCPNLQWQKMSSEARASLARKKADNANSDEPVKRRIYVVRRN